MADPANQDRWDKRSAIALIVYHLVITDTKMRLNIIIYGKPLEAKELRYFSTIHTCMREVHNNFEHEIQRK